MEIKVIKTRKMLPPRDDLWILLKESIDELKENSVVAITSKIVSIGEGRCILAKDSVSKRSLAINEAELYLPTSRDGKGRLHTITQGMLIGSAGIDESNSGDYYILLPKNPDNSAKAIWKFLRGEYKVKSLGIVITDSNAAFMKRGIVGKAIAFYGFSHLRNYVGKKDLFGRRFKYTRINIPDSLAAFAVYLMGEGDEQTPIVVFGDLPNIHFVSRTPNYRKKFMSWKVPMEEDLFRPFLKSVDWKKGGKG